MLRKLQLLTVFTLLSVLSVHAQGGMGTLRGKVLDAGSGEALPFVNLILELNGIQKYGGSTDFDGGFDIKPITPGKYDLKVSFLGYGPVLIKGVVIRAGKITFQDVEMKETAEKLEEVEVVDYVVPLIDKDGGASGGTVTRDDIAKMPGRSAASIATTVGGVASDANGNITSIRGARSDANYYYIDGIKVRGSSSLPKSAIEEVTVVTGGLPANFGDATGGIISITTRGPSSEYAGGIEVLSSGFKSGDNIYGLDKFGYNLVEGSISGPLMFRKDSAGKKTNSLLGFFLSGNFTSRQEPRPLAQGNYIVKDEVLADLLLNPTRPAPTGNGIEYNTDFITMDNLQKKAYRPNMADNSFTLAGKIDVNTGPSVNLAFGGSMDYQRGRLYDYSGSVFNYNNYGLYTDYDWRVYGKLTQRFSNNTEGEENNSLISNAYYTVMIDYSKGYRKREDADHRDNLFGYGYIGKYITHREKSYDFVEQENGVFNMIQSGTYGERDTLVTFIPSDVNAEMAALTSQYFNTFTDPEGNYENFTQIGAGRGLLNGDLPIQVYGLWDNFGTNYNRYQLTDFNQFRITASGAADIGDHAISVGFEYEQRTDRSFRIDPVELWTLMRQESNFHLQELDPSSATTYNIGTTFVTEYDRLVGKDDIFRFSYNLREKLGLDPLGTDLVDVDALDPSMFTLDLFSPDELLDQNSLNVNYYGYDHTGKKQTSSPGLDDFFTEVDENGDFTRPIAPFRPIYIAGFIMDKFTFDDIIFNVGVRIDRYDANQQVLKDQYLLYEARQVSEVTQMEGIDVIHPENMGDDYVVYVNDINDPTAINGYRNGDTWFNADGAEVTDPSVIRAATGIAPYLLDAEQEGPSSSAFKDYEPQVIVMPRVAFSFPISDEALFFAHYDILSKRPTFGDRLNPIDYLYLEEGTNGIISNPNLRPEKTIDYELGFQQVLSKSSSLKISAFYRELRDMVQIINVNEAYPRSYSTYGNVDFGTIKGMTVAYDLRRTGNVWFRAAYTLQFAEGTGSSATSQFNLVNSGQPNLRTISPFSYDQRHQIVGTFDYRYGGGDDYNGPVWFNKRIFENTGANFQANLASGTPYSAQKRITADGTTIRDNGTVDGSSNGQLDGQINGSRNPWQFRVNTQIDRDIVLKFGKDEDNKKTANLNVYLLVNNLFNTLNIINVYRATGNPDDDGYLAAAEFQNLIQQQNDEQAYRELYALKVNNPFNYSVPRTIRLGVRFDF